MAASSSKVVGIKAEVLNDLASRFLINLSSEEKDPIKLCTYIELAHWYYLDLMRPEDPSLPGCNLKEFMRALFQHCPWLLRDSTRQDLDQLITEWKTHKFSKPIRGAIILNQDLTKCLLVQGYTSGSSWGFPKGKLEGGEADIDAAVREVYEETGFDIRALIQDNCYLDANVRDNHVRMYVIVGVAENTSFEPKTRNEIKSIHWFNIRDLPSYKKDKGSLQALGKSSNNFFMIIPFIGQLRRWIKARKSKRKGISANLSGSEHTQSRAQSSPQPQQEKRVVQGSPQPKRSQTFPPAPTQHPESPLQTQPQFQTQPQSQFQTSRQTQPQLLQSLFQSQSGALLGTPRQNSTVGGGEGGGGGGWSIQNLLLGTDTHSTVGSVAKTPLLPTPQSHTSLSSLVGHASPGSVPLVGHASSGVVPLVSHASSGAVPLIGHAPSGAVVGHASSGSVPLLPRPHSHTSSALLGHASSGSVPLLGHTSSGSFPLLGHASSGSVPLLPYSHSSPNSVPLLGSTSPGSVPLLGHASPGLLGHTSPGSLPLLGRTPHHGHASPGSVPLLSHTPHSPGSVPLLGHASPGLVPLLGHASPGSVPLRGHTSVPLLGPVLGHNSNPSPHTIGHASPHNKSHFPAPVSDHAPGLLPHPVIAPSAVFPDRINVSVSNPQRASTQQPVLVGQIGTRRAQQPPGALYSQSVPRADSIPVDGSGAGHNMPSPTAGAQHQSRRHVFPHTRAKPYGRNMPPSWAGEHHRNTSQQSGARMHAESWTKFQFNQEAILNKYRGIPQQL